MTSSGTRLTVKSGAQAGLTERANFLELRKAEVQLWRVHHGRTSGPVKLHSWVTTLGQQGTEPDLRIYAGVHRCEGITPTTHAGQYLALTLDISWALHLAPALRRDTTTNRRRPVASSL